ncbi:hypothetical protein N0V84_009608 [Fusarium piperis]|uniref:Uncharacterized protein n=1 Tax=Fusarium piperis TaxID=1435070 RepID=A0A9W8W608_9HYPO|nr:hypothetical protein N0V84_009608 [Fusarium piperis]
MALFCHVTSCDTLALDEGMSSQFPSGRMTFGAESANVVTSGPFPPRVDWWNPLEDTDFKSSYMFERDWPTGGIHDE